MLVKFYVEKKASRPGSRCFVKLEVRKGTDRKVASRNKKRMRIRKKIFGTAVRPRLSVFRSGRHLYAQVIDDSKG